MKLARISNIFKTLGFILLLIVILIGTIYLGRNASSYFVKADTCTVKTAEAKQVGANSAVITYDTGTAEAQGRILYGTNQTNMTISTMESSPAKGAHNVPLSLLTPNTDYYFVIKIGNTTCDFSGQPCDSEKGKCVPWQFRTSTLAMDGTVPGLPESGASTPSAIPLNPSGSASRSGGLTASPTSAAGRRTPSLSPRPSQAASSGSAVMSSNCGVIRAYIGESTRDATRWASLRKYDFDSNGTINGADVSKCNVLKNQR